MQASTAHTSPSAFQRMLELLARLAIGIAAAALLALVVVQGWQVFARYVINDSPSWTEPVTLLLLATAMSLGAAAGVHTNRHFGFYLLHDHVRPAMRTLIDVLVQGVVIGVGAVIAYWAAVLLLDGLDIRTAGAALPQSINYLPLTIGGALMVLFGFNRLLITLGMQPPMPVAVATTSTDGDL